MRRKTKGDKPKVQARTRWARVLFPALILLILTAAFLFSRVWPLTQYVKRGLDIAGGVRLVLQGEPTANAPITRQAMEDAARVIERRVNTLGVSEPNIQLEGQDRIVVELADVHDVERAREMVGKTAVLRFVGPDGQEVLTGNDVERAQAVQDPASGKFVVALSLKGEGPKKFEEATRKYLGQPIAIYLDDEMISNPVVQSVITGGQAQIIGDFTAQEAADLASLINGGALPVKLNIIENRSISPTLGQAAFQKSLQAGAVGVALVMLFMVAVYRLPGFLADLALIVYLFLTAGALIAIDAVLTLPGIAGIVLSLGMSVDANIVIFERIKDELRKGTGLRSAIDAGFHRAFAAVADANLTTIAAGLILQYFGTGPIKGFGLTLWLGTAISFFTAVTLSRWLLVLAVNTGWFSKRSLFGIREEVQA